MKSAQHYVPYAFPAWAALAGFLYWRVTSVGFFELLDPAEIPEEASSAGKPTGAFPGSSLIFHGLHTYHK